MLPVLRVTAVAALAWVGVAGWRASGASAEARTAREQAVSMASRLAEVQRLKPQQQTALLTSKPTESVSASVRTALASAGLGDTTLRAVTPGSDEAVQANAEGGPSYRRQNVTVSLAPLAPRQLGAFLAAWRAAEPAWIVTRIDLTHTGPDTESAYDARLMLSTTYLAPDSTPTK